MNKLTLIAGLGLLGLSSSTLAANDKGPGQSRLDTLDTNEDGLISFVEFQEADSNRLTEIDPDLNGMITLDEFINARPDRESRRGNRGNNQERGQTDRQPDPERMEQMRQRMEQRAQERFEELDADGDGQVALEDIQMANFTAMDRDEDGFLSAQELRRRGPGMGGPRGRGGQRGGQSPQE